MDDRERQRWLEIERGKRAVRENAYKVTNAAIINHWRHKIYVQLMGAPFHVEINFKMDLPKDEWRVHVEIWEYNYKNTIINEFYPVTPEPPNELIAQIMLIGGE